MCKAKGRHPFPIMMIFKQRWNTFHFSCMWNIRQSNGFRLSVGTCFDHFCDGRRSLTIWENNYCIVSFYYWCYCWIRRNRVWWNVPECSVHNCWCALSENVKTTQNSVRFICSPFTPLSCITHEANEASAAASKCRVRSLRWLLSPLDWPWYSVVWEGSDSISPHLFEYIVESRI